MSEIVNVKPVQSRYITIDELTFQNLTGNEHKIYMALRFESDYSKKCSTVELTIDSLTILAKVSRSKVFEALNSLENTHFLIQRTNYKSFKYGKINSYLVARDYKYFKQNDKEFITHPDSSTGGQSYYTRPDSGPISPESGPISPENGIPIDHNLSIINSEREASPSQNTDLAIIRKSNPLAAFLPDKYLLMQKQLTIQCLSDEKAYALFESKFGKLEVTFEEMLYECVMYYALKPEAQNVSKQRFIAWIKREKVEIYDKKPDSVAHKLYRDLTEQEKSLVSDYMHFKKYPDLQHRMTDIQKKQAQDLLDLLKSTQNMRAI